MCRNRQGFSNFRRIYGVQETLKSCIVPRLRGVLSAGVITCASSYVGVVSAQAPKEIVINAGDSLASIAETYDVTVTQIKKANGLSTDILAAGEILVLPGQPYGRTTYRVKQGDTLTELAVAFDMSVKELMGVNRLMSSDLSIGQVLHLTEKQSSDLRSITVSQGDTLSAIAKRYDVSVEALQIANSLENTNILPDQRLLLPTGAREIPSEYTVRSGDTLYDIAVAFDMSTDELIANNSLDGTVIKVGQVLSLVGKAPPPPLEVIVQVGDSLWDIAQRNNTTVDDLRIANNLAKNHILHRGDTLTIPQQFASSAQVAQADVGGTASRTIVVAKGDTLSTIAKRYNTSVTALMVANNLPSAMIDAGQTLNIVPSSQLQAAAPAVEAPVAPVAVTNDSGIVWPLNGLITSKYGYRRLSITNNNFHTGLDIDGETGDIIVAAGSGTVVFSGWYGGYGNLVIVQAGNVEFYYAHASSLLVSEGEQVLAGQAIARVGATGVVTGSHLHFEIRVDDEPVDPLPILEKRASL